VNAGTTPRHEEWRVGQEAMMREDRAVHQKALAENAWELGAVGRPKQQAW
jgi:hypothetical protein